MYTIDEVIDELQQIRQRLGKNSPIRLTFPSPKKHHHYDIIGFEVFEYDEDTEIILVRSGSEVATEIR